MIRSDCCGCIMSGEMLDMKVCPECKDHCDIDYSCDMCGERCTDPDLLCAECAKKRQEDADERDLYGGPEL